MQSLCYTLATLLCGSICFVFRVFNMRHLAGAARHHQIDKSMKCEVSSTTKTSNQLKAIKPQQEVTRTQQQQKKWIYTELSCWMLVAIGLQAVEGIFLCLKLVTPSSSSIETPSPWKS